MSLAPDSIACHSRVGVDLMNIVAPVFNHRRILRPQYRVNGAHADRFQNGGVFSRVTVLSRCPPCRQCKRMIRFTDAVTLYLQTRT